MIMRVKVSEILEALHALSWGTFSLLMLISVLLVYLSSLKWSYFLSSYGVRASVVSLFNVYLVGYFVNLVFPSTLGGDALRSWYVGKKSNQHNAFASTLLERYTGFTAMVAMGVVGAWITTLVSDMVRYAVVLLALAVVGATVLSLYQGTSRILRKIPVVRNVASHFEKLQQALVLASKQPSLLCKGYLVSFFYHTCTIANTVAAAWAVGWWDPPVAELFIVVPLALIVGALPITPSGLGVQEGAFYLLLTQVGATPAQALGVALVLRLKTYLLAIVGGGCWIILRLDGGVRLRGNSLEGQDT